MFHWCGLQDEYPSKAVMIYCVIFFTSAAVLGYEITFTRVFSYAQWQNLSPVIITMALLGSGAAGTVVTIAGDSIRKNPAGWLSALAFMFPLFTAAGFIISAMLPVNPYAIGFSALQVFYIFIYLVLMCLPFLAGSAIVCVSLMEKPPSAAYAVNLFGSGAGGALPLLLSYYMHPYGIMAAVIMVSLVPAIMLAVNRGSGPSLIAAAFLTVATASALVFSFTPGFRMVSEYKPVSGALNLPGGRVIYESYSPLSVIQVVEAAGLRSTAGLSLASPYQVPVQRQIYFDGDSPSAVTPYSGAAGETAYIRYLSSWLPYYMRQGGGRALLIGTGGGESILKAMIAGFGSIDAVEINRGVISLMQDELAVYSGNIYNNEKVRVHSAEGRSFARAGMERYDLIDIPMIDAFNSAASGVYALNESYLYTVESFTVFCSRLSPSGILSVTRWITTPPRDSLKIFNTAAGALRAMNIAEPGRHLMAIRSVQTLTVLVSVSPFTGDDIAALKKFCRERLFDVVYYPGMKQGEADRNIKQENGLLFRSFTALIGPGYKDFIRSYEWDISAADDNRPYFYNFFRPAVMGYIMKYGSRQVPVTEWGCLLLLIILVPVMTVSFICILLPLITGGSPVPGSGRTIPYFALIAAGYFFVEMPLIQKMVLFLGSPVFSMGIIISTILVSGGAGSFFSGSGFSTGRGIRRCILVISAVILAYSFAIDAFFNVLIQYTIQARIVAAILLVGLPAFFMGIPFPAGLSMLRGRHDTAIPFAWGVNGFFSVISIIAASVGAVTAGYKAVLCIAVMFYMLAGFAAPTDNDGGEGD